MLNDICGFQQGQNDNWKWNKIQVEVIKIKVCVDFFVFFVLDRSYQSSANWPLIKNPNFNVDF